MRNICHAYFWREMLLPLQTEQHTHCQKLSKTWTRVPACSYHLRHLNMSSISVAVRPCWEKARRCKRYSTLRHIKTKHSQLNRSTTLLVETRKLRKKKERRLPLHCSLPLRTGPFLFLLPIVLKVLPPRLLGFSCEPQTTHVALKNLSLTTSVGMGFSICFNVSH